MPPFEAQTSNTPLAPSVEKAYYRKCIELKRRLNEVESANDEMKFKRVRLDRSIMKMRLERAFLLEQLEKRMQQNAEASEGSGDEGMATPPPDRPHRDKRRRAPQSSAPGTGPAGPGLTSQTSSSGHQHIQPAPPGRSSSSQQPSRRSQGSLNGPTPPRDSEGGAPGHGANGTHAEGGSDEGGAQHDETNRAAGATGEAFKAGLEVGTDVNGDQRIVED
ncbi:hypothetical protein K431DRAFT_346916 [Polychaeton citri CBS 116435]|uniref:INO80 complex subunit F domain-containing protein n=1 Tax=Polychaeton citri CBS 116435 TaxID=1314669 RepID=A0A9P4Q7A1_9PEZI|nr:hypothetical protein K431DRAFT_346916 [Polychaeton citri CBS 116435]